MVGNTRERKCIRFGVRISGQANPFCSSVIGKVDVVIVKNTLFDLVKKGTDIRSIRFA
jgi:hypothetical protein